MILNKKYYRYKNPFFDIFHYLFFKLRLTKLGGTSCKKMTVDLEKCSVCLLCINLCPVNAIKIDYDENVKTSKRSLSLFSIDQRVCFLCNECVLACPDDALKLEKSPPLSYLKNELEQSAKLHFKK